MSAGADEGQHWIGCRATQKILLRVWPTVGGVIRWISLALDCQC